ncbi:probable choline kinase 2 isoform X2 [Prosopis cineraria]|uniref:probable choline kinase 2 isoform X2 n=1 Tax=Prosopis cineraria TaxID=364024 RepID=UPI00240F5AB1|nr:probable choline kinase 2 isoform X2 [Prosopis cineraria]
MASTENPVKDKADHPVEDKADHPLEDKADHNVIGKEDHPLGGKADPPVADKADHPVVDKADHPAVDKADHPVVDKADHPAVDKADHPAVDKADHSVEDKADHLVKDKKDDSVVEKTVHPANNKSVDLPEEAKALLKSLASEWNDVQDADALQVIPLKGAMTNKVFQIKWPTKTEEPSRKVIVRIYGEGVENFFDRDDEIRAFEFLSKNEQGPQLLGRFSNGRIEEFIKARTLSASDLRDPSISALIAAKMKEFHNLEMPGPKKIIVWDKIRKWISIAKGLSSPEEVEAFYLDTIDKEVDILEKELSSDQQLIGFCHNDLQYGNIMLKEETNSVTLIDYEYSGYNPVAYDIANHFCEMAADYHTDAPHVLDFSKCPDLEERKRFVQAYLSTSGQEPSDSEVEQLLQEAEKYTLANHLFWGLWGVISAHVNKIDFNYMEYAKQRIKEYWARKPYLLCSAGPSLETITTEENRTQDQSSSNRGNSVKTPFFKKLKKVFGMSVFRSRS